jgi:hypothetical protein
MAALKTPQESRYKLNVRFLLQKQVGGSYFKNKKGKGPENERTLTTIQWI